MSKLVENGQNYIADRDTVLYIKDQYIELVQFNNIITNITADKFTVTYNKFTFLEFKYVKKTKDTLGYWKIRIGNWPYTVIYHYNDSFENLLGKQFPFDYGRVR